MEMKKWKRRRLVPTWGDNHQEEEPCVIVFHPPTVGWMSRWRELAVRAPSLGVETLGERMSEEGYLDSLTEWTEELQGFREEIMLDLIVGVEALTMDGKDADLSDALGFILEHEGLREEVFAAILKEGAMSEAQGKD